MHAIESIGPVLGIVAFVGLAILAFLLFQQARDIRRLREWAGRAPERAAEAANAVQAAADTSRDGEAAEEEGAMGVSARLRSGWERFTGAVRDRCAAIDRRLPVDGRFLLAILVIAVVVVGVVTSGFGLVGGGAGAGGRDGKRGNKKLPSVAVINGTSVPGLAAAVEDKVVKRAGYEPGPVGNAASSVDSSVVEYAGGLRSEAQALAKAVEPKLGHTPLQPMTSDVGDVSGKAKLALLLGLDDAGFGGAG
jgi:LytR cell envelope-related transcriptional attenuator